MNTLAQYLGTETYPLNDAMHLGKRTQAEYQYLIEHGFFSHYYRKYLIRKHNNVYQLLRNNAPEPELEAESATLDALIKDHDLPIAQFQWHINWIDDNEPIYPTHTEEEWDELLATPESQAFLDTLEQEALEALAQQQEMEPA